MKITGIFFTSAIIVFTCSFSAYSMQKLAGNELKKIKGQASVEIEIDNMQIKSDSLKIIYIDEDGTGNSMPATATISMGSTIQSFNAIIDETSRDGVLSGTYSGSRLYSKYGINSSSDSSNLTIGIEEKLPMLSSIKQFLSGNETLSVQGIQVYLPTLEMNISGGTRSINFQQDGAINNNIEFCIRQITGIRTTAILGGRVEIAGR